MVDSNVTTRTVAVDEEYQDLRESSVPRLPQKLALFGQGQEGITYSTSRRLVSSADFVGALVGWRSQLHLMAREAFNRIPADGAGSVEVSIYPLQADVAGTAAAGSITPTGTAATRDAVLWIEVSGYASKQFTVPKGTIVAATVIAQIIAACTQVAHLPILMTDGTTNVVATVPWKGASGNDVFLAVKGDLDAGIGFTIVQPTGGATNPSLTDSINLMGTRHETVIVNPFEYDDTTSLGAFQVEGESRWDETVNRQFVCFTGNTVADRATATAVSDALPTDRVNCYAMAPGSPMLPCVVAAAVAVKVARTANNTPAVGYGARKLSSITPGSETQQWNNTDRQLAVDAGCSTSVVGSDGVLQINDLVTFYHPTGEEPKKYSEVVTIMKLINALYVLQQEFTQEKWAKAPLVADSSATTLPEAKKPRQVKTACLPLLKGLERDAIIVESKLSFRNTTAVIDGTNPNRMNIEVPFVISGIGKVYAITARWGFNFGQVV